MMTEQESAYMRKSEKSLRKIAANRGGVSIERAQRGKQPRGGSFDDHLDYTTYKQLQRETSQPINK
jgi:hypothetical protein